MPDSIDQWTAIHFRVPHEMADPICNFCHEQQTEGLVLDDSDRDFVRLTAYFTPERWEEALDHAKLYLTQLHEIFSHLPEPTLSISVQEREDWAVMWKGYFKPTEIGKRLIVAPPWRVPEPGDRLVVIIEPAEAFGTGTHETTQGCLVLVEDAISEMPAFPGECSVLDVGCGSGILAIAAAKLGADRVLGIDHDPKAVESAGKNAALNHVEEKVQLARSGLADLTEQSDIVTANLDLRTLREHRNVLLSLFRRFLIVSGVPLNQWAEAKELLQAPRVVLVKEITRAEWGCGLFGRTRGL
ncbi:MAG: 50S ribosomal protein L11 methyltransferase [Thermodesulfobacteriota bacterium]